METKKGQAKRNFAVLLMILVLSMASISYGDRPYPAGARWRIVPTTLSPTEIQMAAVTAIDASGHNPCEYYFECTTDGNKTSGWISDPNYIATGLDPNTTYQFRAKARDTTLTETLWSYTIPATTDACTTPPVLRLDFNGAADRNDDPLLPGQDANTETGFNRFVLENSGSEVNGIVIDISGNVSQSRRNDPCYGWSKYAAAGVVPGDPCYAHYRAGEKIDRDFIWGLNPGGVTITLWGLGVNRDCNITMWAIDMQVTDANQVAKWYANGTYIFDTNFIGGTASFPKYINQTSSAYLDLYKFAWSGIATADDLGRIILTSEKSPSSPDDEPFVAYVNALRVEPNVLSPFVPTNYAHRPGPSDGAEDVSIDMALSWRAGGLAATHDVYLGTDEAAVIDANRSNPMDVLASQGQEPNSFDPYGAAGFLSLDTTYYWRIDEVNDANIWKGDVWSFRTVKCIVAENFDSYASDTDLRKVWKAQTCALVYVEYQKVRSDKSMEYWFRNNSYAPYYSEVRVDVNTARPNGLGLDPNWLGIGAKSLALWFYGDLGNDANEPMYLKLTDGDDVNATVAYDGNMNDITEPWWHEWNIDLQDFADGGVDLSDVKTLTIGIGDETQAASDGVVWIEDIHLCITQCVLSKRSADFAEADYAPLPCGDCVVDYQELKIMADEWLYTWWWDWEPSPPPWPPSIPNLVAYWPMNEGDGNRIYTDPCDPDWTGVFSPSGVSWVMPGYVNSIAALRFDGNPGTRIICGNENPAEPNGQITLSVWAKWFGPRYWESYLMMKGQGIIGKRSGWGESYMMFELELDTNGTNRSIGFRHYAPGDDATPDLFAPSGIMNQFIGQWVHITAAFPYPSGDPEDANSYARIYLNGSQVADGPWRFSAGTDAYLTIGNTMDVNAWPDSPEAYYGDLDEVCIYNRALTEEEIVYLASYVDPDMRPIYEAVNLYFDEPCPLELGCQQVINFKDFAVVANYWLEEDMFP